MGSKYRYTASIYKAASYLCAHFSKVEDEISVAMEKAAKETLSRKVEINYTMKK